MNGAPLLLDTCAAIWISQAERISDAALDAVQEMQSARGYIYVSPITAWEIGVLMSRGRLSSPLTPQRWFQRLMQAPGLRLADLSPDTLIASSFLPGEPPRDPADRILAATAREQGCRLMTRDRLLLAYAAQGHLQVIPC